MKRGIFIFVIVGFFIRAQNYLPISGGNLTNNLIINGTDASWAENLLLIKPTGWGGIRFSRRDPSSGNFDGNWAMGYNANTGNDFSISSNYQQTQYDYLFHISAATRNIGIGLSNPQYKVHIKGQLAATQILGGNNVRYDGGMGGIDFYDNGVGYPYSAKLYTFKSDASGEFYGLTNDYDGNGGQLSIISKYINGLIGFYTGSSTTRKMTIMANGNVGIGTVNPAYKLDVLGTIRTKEVLVNLDGGADFVFEKGYKLLPIEHVANYVQENKHLPDIPSANEMVKNGVSMGDMQVKLLQKVEELTLYAIQENNSKKELERKYNALLEKVEMLTKQIEKK